MFGPNISFTVKEKSLFLPFYISPSTHWDCWISCCRYTRPRLLSGTNFKKLERRCRGKYGREKKKERSSSGTTEPLQLFKWPLSLCSCSLCLVWILKWRAPHPKKRKKKKAADIEKTKLVQRANTWVCLTFTFLPERLMSRRLSMQPTAWLWRGRYSCHVWPKFH